MGSLVMNECTFSPSQATPYLVYRKEQLIAAFCSSNRMSCLSGMNDVSISCVTGGVVKRELFNRIMTQKIKHRANQA